jgi:tetratricopeptide (TPR) repeat protein
MKFSELNSVWKKTGFILLVVVTISVLHIQFSLPITRFGVEHGFKEELFAHMYSDNAEVLFYLGSRHLGGGGRYDLLSSERYLTSAERIDPSLYLVHYQLARVYFLTTRYTLALNEVNKEIKNSPNFSRNYYLRGLIYGYDKKLPEAASDFEEFINREPDEWAGYNDLAWILFQLGDYRGVKESMEQILVSVRNAWLLNAYGVALLNLGELEAAHNAFTEARELASRMSPEEWGTAYIGNDPRIYGTGLEEMRRNIDENLERVNNALSEKE